MKTTRERLEDAIQQADNLGRSLQSIIDEIDKPKETPWPRLEILEGPLGGMYIKSRAGFVDDGTVYGLKYKGKTGILMSGNGYSLESFEEKGFVGTLTLQDGTQIAFPAWAGGYAEMSPHGLYTYNKLRTYSLQLRSGVVGPDGHIYSPQFSKSGGVIRYNRKKKTIRAIPYHRDSSSSWFKGHWGIASGSGKMFLLPWLDDKIGIIRGMDKVEQLPGKVTSGLLPYELARSPKYSHGLTVGDEIICFPRRGKRMLIINHVTEAYEELSLPPELIEAFQDCSKSFGSYLGPDGWLYAVMWGIGIQMRFNPKTREIQWRDLRDEIAETGWLRHAKDGAITWGNGISTEAYMIGDSAYHLPGDGRAYKMVFEGGVI